VTGAYFVQKRSGCCDLASQQPLLQFHFSM
jgi:hypothetical protein